MTEQVEKYLRDRGLIAVNPLNLIENVMDELTLRRQRFRLSKHEEDVVTTFAGELINRITDTDYDVPCDGIGKDIEYFRKEFSHDGRIGYKISKNGNEYIDQMIDFYQQYMKAEMMAKFRAISETGKEFDDA